MHKSETKYKIIKVPNVTYKSVLSKYRNIKKRNEVFNNLDDETKRREIAFDALKLLLNEKIIPAGGFTNGNYALRAYFGPKLVQKLQDITDSEKMQEEVLNLPDECSVCARGAMMLSTIRLGNELAVDDEKGITMGDIAMGTRKTRKGFDVHAFEAMENMYEQSNTPYPLRSRYSLMNILCNVVKNGDYVYHYVDYLKDKKVLIK